MTERYPAEQLDEDWEDDGTMQSNVDALAEAVVGHRIVEVVENAQIDSERSYWGSGYGLQLTLDNGRKVFLADTDDCCAYTDLQGILKHLDQIDHVIMGVGTTNGFSTWHIYADMGDVLELEVGWSAGNPFYYGYGFDISVVEPEEQTAIEQ